MANYIITKDKQFFLNIDKNYKFKDINEVDITHTIGVDTETTGLSWMQDDMFAVQISNEKGDNYLFDLQDNTGYTFEDIIPLLSQAKVMIFHNAVFDLRFFYKHNFFPKFVIDTFLSSKLLYVGQKWVRHNFGAVMERELGIKYDKSEQKNIHNIKLTTKESIEYCFNDVDKLIPLGRKLYNRHKENNSLGTFWLHNNYVRALPYIEMSGLPIDKDKWKQKMESDKKEYEKARQDVIDYLISKFPDLKNPQKSLFDDDNNNDDLNVLLTSQQQMIPIFKRLGINTKDKDGKDSLNKDVINKSNHEFVKLWIKLSKIEKDVTTYGKNIYDNIKNGRIYTEYVSLLDTARISTVSTKKGGLPLLTFPKGEKTRGCFIAKEGNLLVGCDYAGQETRVLGALSNDKATIESVVNNKDLHCAFARVIFPELKDLSDKEIKKEHSDKRQYAKAPRFLFSYGGNAFTLHTNNNIPLKQAIEIENGFKELHNGVYKWGEKVYEDAIKVGYIESAGGFKLHLPQYDIFKELHDDISELDNDFWKRYSNGKKEYQKMQKYLKSKTKNSERPTIYNEDDYHLYKQYKDKMKRYFGLKAKYMKLALNNPIQTTSAHQTKSAVVKVFDYIIDNDDAWKVLICVTPHDEILLETPKEKADEYKKVLETTMIEEGNKWIKHPKIFMDADAQIGKSWHDVH